LKNFGFNSLPWNCLFLVVELVAAGCNNNAANVSPTVNITPFQVILLPGQNTQFTETGLGGAIAWAVNGVDGGSPATGTINSSGIYTAPTVPVPSNQLLQISVHRQSTKIASALAYVSMFSAGNFAPGTVSATSNPQVALYSLTAPQNTSVQISFGPTTAYGLTTWAQPAPPTGGNVSIFVAGMRANTTYHMQAAVLSPDGTRIFDSDHVFTPGGGGVSTFAAVQPPPFPVSTPSGLPPQPGAELIALTGAQPTTVATDLQGNIIWSYTHEGTLGEFTQPVKLLPNGDVVMVIGPNSSLPAPAGFLNVAREINLAGATVRDISVATLNTRLAAAKFNYVATYMHHDIVALPNGHWLVIVNSTKQFTDLPGFPGTTPVLGDAIVDLDTNLQPVWLWNSFDHLDVNRHPYLFPDWTHSNAIVYSPDDGNLLLSIRHQNWIIKIDYQDGKGSGDVIWRLGQGGDFTLQGATDPTDWFYAQHSPSFASPNTTGVFSLVLFDNGDDRMFPAGVTCGSAGAPPCFYSTVPILQIDENSKVATVAFRYTPQNYSFFGGGANVLDNGNIENDLCAPLGVPVESIVTEVTNQPTPQIVWQMTIPGEYAYRAFRIPSLYPGVQW
jgi:arylsulfate sulfotransferase